MRTLSIDLGSKRIGLAMSDASGRFVSPVDVLTVSAVDHAIGPIVQMIERESVQRVVLGLPLNMDDSIGPQARGVIAWAKKLREATPVPVIFVDERLSSFSAEQQLIDVKRAGAKMTRKNKKNALDAIAACHFLQAFLDGQLQAIEVGE